jgi:hypothetical protein
MEIREHSPSTLKNIDGGLHGEVVTEILERPPSTLKNIDGGPPWEVLTEIQERPPSTLINVNCGPPGPRGRVQSPSGIRKVCCKSTWA